MHYLSDLKFKTVKLQKATKFTVCPNIILSFKNYYDFGKILSQGTEKYFDKQNEIYFSIKQRSSRVMKNRIESWFFAPSFAGKGEGCFSCFFFLPILNKSENPISVLILNRQSSFWENPPVYHRETKIYKSFYKQFFPQFFCQKWTLNFGEEQKSCRDVA